MRGMRANIRRDSQGGSSIRCREHAGSSLVSPVDKGTDSAVGESTANKAIDLGAIQTAFGTHRDAGHSAEEESDGRAIPNRVALALDLEPGGRRKAIAIDQHLVRG